MFDCIRSIALVIGETFDIAATRPECAIRFYMRGGERRLRGGDRLRRAHMHPNAFEAQAEQPAVRAGAVEQQRQRKCAAGASANSAGDRIAAPA